MSSPCVDPAGVSDGTDGRSGSSGKLFPGSLLRGKGFGTSLFYKKQQTNNLS